MNQTGSKLSRQLQRKAARQLASDPQAVIHHAVDDATTDAGNILWVVLVQEEQVDTKTYIILKDKVAFYEKHKELYPNEYAKAISDLHQYYSSH